MVAVVAGLLFTNTMFLAVPPHSSSVSWSSLRGVNYYWTTVRDPNRPELVAPPPSISFPEIRQNGWNLIRVVLHWNDYAANSTEFISNIQEIASYAQQNGLYIVWDLIHQAGTSSQYTYDGQVGEGFPIFLTAPYATPKSFWAAWWSNQTSFDGNNGWSMALAYDMQVVRAVDNYSSTLGYEILNEPPIWSSNSSSDVASFNLQGMAAFNTYIASAIRTYSTKTIIFMKPYFHPDIDPSCILPSPSCLLLVAPRGVSNLALDYHQYNYFNSTVASYYQQFSLANKIPILLGEFGPCSRLNASCPTSESSVIQGIQEAISTAHSDGWAWCYWAWREGRTGPPWQSLLNSTGSQWWLDREIIQIQIQVYGK
ncbi:MAG: cellulase family glycosylhydrolase [Candidatus Parvarchaeota archaeon]